MPAVSVIIATKNRREVLVRNLRRLHECTFKDLEVVVVDDGSSDGTSEAVSSLSPRPRLVRLDKSIGPGRARNAGMAVASGKYFFFMDDDAYVEFEAFEKMIKTFEGDPRTGAITFRITSVVDGSIKTHDYTQPYCKSIWAIATGIRADVAREVGGFTQITDFHGEEFDYAVRLIDHGYKIRYAPEIQAYDEAAGRRLEFPAERLVNVRNWVLIFFNLFPFRVALLLSARAITSFGIRSAKERSAVQFCKGLAQIVFRLPGVLMRRQLVSASTVTLYTDPDFLPDSYNVPIARKIRRKMAAWWGRGKDRRAVPGSQPR